MKTKLDGVLSGVILTCAVVAGICAVCGMLSQPWWATVGMLSGAAMLVIMSRN